MMVSVLFLAPGDLIPAVPSAVLVNVSRLKALTPAMLKPCRMSEVVRNIWPLPVRSAVTGNTVPVLVLTTGSTANTDLVTGLKIRLLTMAVLVTNAVCVTNTVVVKLWQMKKPGNQKPNQKTG